MNEDAHLRLIRRWLGGEIVDNHVGIRARGGPFDGKIRIMRLDATGSPPTRVRGRRGGGCWHVYVLVSDPDEASAWVYRYDGTEPLEVPAA
jgi:hypothetical protein